MSVSEDIMLSAIVRIGIPLLFLCVIYDLAGASAQVAPGVQQSAAQTANITGMVLQSDGTPVASADVQLNGLTLQLSTKSDAHGTFSFSTVPYGSYSVDVTSTTLGVASREDIVVKGDINVSIQYSAQTSSTMKTIAHVSTRSAGASINVTPASIASVSPSAWAFEGNTSWKELMQQIPGVAAYGAPYGFGVNFIPGSPFDSVILSINGALPYETSTTLDGMPLVNTTIGGALGGQQGTEDLSQLPLTSFDSVDIVRGPGANAPSILNSIGGSLVLHAPGYVDANHLNFSASTDPWGGYDFDSTLQLHLSSRLSAWLGYSVYNSPGPQGNNSSSFLLNPYVGAGSQPVTINGNTLYGCGSAFASSNFGSPTCTVGYYGPYLQAQDGLPPPPEVTPLYQACARVYSCYNEGATGLLVCCGTVSSAFTQHGYSGGFTYKASPSIVTQLFYSGASATDQAGNAFYGAWDFEPGAGYSGSFPAGQYLLNSNAGLGGEQFHQSNTLFEEKITAFIGRGVLRLAALQNTSWGSYNDNNSVAGGVYTLYGATYNCVGSNCATQTYNVYNGTSAALTFNTEYVENYIASKNRDVLVSYGTQIGSKASVGISYVQSYYNQGPGGLSAIVQFGTNYCAVFGVSFCNYPSDPSVNETSRELRLNAESQLSDRLDLDLSYYIARGSYHVGAPDTASSTIAGVYSAYDDLNFPYSTPRLGLAYRASKDVALRLAAGGGFALPTLDSITGGTTAVSCIPGIGYCTANASSISLQPEKSFGFDVGTDIRLHRDTVLSFDLYRVNLYGQFYSNEATESCSVAICGGLPLYVEQTRNLAQTRYEGINFSLNHSVPHGFNWSAGVGLTRSYVVSVPANFYNSTPGVPCNFTSLNTCTNYFIIPGINFSGGAYGGAGAQPYANGSGSLGYNWSPEKYVSITATYYGNNNTYYVPAFVSFDGHIGYQLTKNVALIGTFRNITNADGGSNLINIPETGAPSAIIGMPPGVAYPNPLGPRTFIFTLNYKY
jgi:outer membrane receptor protein involved in Fe transport